MDINTFVTIVTESIQLMRSRYPEGTEQDLQAWGYTLYSEFLTDEESDTISFTGNEEIQLSLSTGEQYTRVHSDALEVFIDNIAMLFNTTPEFIRDNAEQLGFYSRPEARVEDPGEDLNVRG